jgi:predicted dinucleotide-binding enzyme
LTRRFTKLRFNEKCGYSEKPRRLDAVLTVIRATFHGCQFGSAITFPATEHYVAADIRRHRSTNDERSHTMRTAIIGVGHIGSTLAANLIAGGESVILSGRSLAKTRELAATLGGRAQALPPEEALEKADIVVLAISFAALKEFVDTHRTALAGKVVVDPSNPIAPDGNGGFKKLIPQDQSSGQIIASLVRPGTQLVKAFGTLSANSLAAAANRTPERAVLFYATDVPDAGKAVAELITASGFEPMSVGGLDQSIRIEAFGDLHEFGKLGKVVSAQEAKAAL